MTIITTDYHFLCGLYSRLRFPPPPQVLYIQPYVIYRSAIYTESERKVRTRSKVLFLRQLHNACSVNARFTEFVPILAQIFKQPAYVVPILLIDLL
jgi:hypothetical protein